MRKILNNFKLKSVTVSNLPPISNFNYNYLIGVVMLYMTLSILSGLTVYKFIQIDKIILPAGIFTTPLTYCLSNVITEVYGLYLIKESIVKLIKLIVGRNLMWWSQKKYYNVLYFSLKGNS